MEMVLGIVFEFVRKVLGDEVWFDFVVFYFFGLNYGVERDVGVKLVVW